MRIDEITFHNFKSRDRFASVNFSDDNVTIIFGDNGCGKTTFLKAISAFLSQDESSLKALGVNRRAGLSFVKYVNQRKSLT
ncbi:MULTISPECIES: AAA family ATPase [Shewanella]|uniref:AAA family ATPase n=1 Tax=Shewanella TaxID=22 RepID=UPI000569916D|nr:MULTISPECIES: AAA family ATPase [Shewanella]PWH04434.1 hypothetical protein DIY08_01245 [Shewanella xiamenensis]